MKYIWFILTTLILVSLCLFACLPKGVPCSDCVEGQQRCGADGRSLETCVKHHANYCMKWLTQLCVGGVRCVEKGERAFCDHGNQQTCPTSCKLGERRCTGDVIEVCESDAHSNCNIWSIVQACTNGQICDPATAQCRLSSCQPTQPQKEMRCVGSAVYWFDDCGVQGALAQTCAANQRCEAGRCVDISCQPTQPQKEMRCVGSAVYWFDDCDVQGALAQTCAANQRCEAGRCVDISCQPTQPQKEMRCVGSVVYWFDDCGAQGALVQTCHPPQICKDAKCQSPADPCASLNECSNGATRCAAGGVQTCDQNTKDLCWRWSNAIPCAAGSHCEGGQCVPTQSQNAAIGEPCQQGRDCQGGVCISWPGGYCSAFCSSGCPAGSICGQIQSDQGPVQLCFKACTNDSACRSGYTCYQNKACLYTGTSSGCRSDSDCAAGQRCNTATGQCVSAGCRSDSDCAAGQRCNTATGQCVSAGCTSNADCSAGQVCQAGQCVAPPCKSDADCLAGQICQSGVCKVSGQSGRPGVVENRQITVNGANQTYVLYVGRGYTGTTSAAVLIAFHGYGDSASNYIQTSRWMTLADQHGFILGVPHKPASGGKSSGSWDAYSTSSSDLSFADAVSKDIQDNHNTNPKRLYAVGFSQGGYFTYLYGMTRASTLAAFGVQAASSPGLPLTASRKIAAIFVIGSLDSAYNRAQQDSQNLQKAGHPTQFIGLPNEGHCCAAQHSKNADVWSFFQNHPLP